MAENSATELADQPVSTNGHSGVGRVTIEDQARLYGPAFRFFDVIGDRCRTSDLDHFINEVSKPDGGYQLKTIYDTWKIERSRLNSRPKESSHPSFPPQVYSNLPSLLRDFCDFFKAGEKRDVVLLSSFSVLSATNPNVRFRYDRFYLTPHLYVFIKALSGFGKGVMRHALRFGKGVDTIIRDESETDISEWRAKDAKYERWCKSPENSDTPNSDFKDAPEPPGPKPKEKMLFVGSNLTAAAVAERMVANPSLVVFSTEASEMAHAIASQFGGFDTTLRSSFHNEPFSVERKSSGTLRIENPGLSVLLSGTNSAFMGLLGRGLEDGLFSRFLLYTCTAKPVYESQRPKDDDSEFETTIDLIAERTTQIYKQLAARESALDIEADNSTWQQIDELYRALHDSVAEDGAYALIPVIRRNIIITYRIAAICCVWRAYEAGTNLTAVPHLKLSEADLTVGYGVASTCLQHGVKAAERLDNTVRGTSPKQRAFLAELDNEFTTQDAKDAGESVGISPSTMFEWLKYLRRLGAIEKGSQGVYRKKSDIGVSDSFGV